MSISLAASADIEAPSFVEAVIRFTDPASAGAVLHSDDHESSTFKLVPRTVRISNARPAAEPLSLEANGFTLIDAPFDIDFHDREEVERRYFPEAQRIARELTGASEVVVFLDVIRSETRDAGMEVANNAHVDFDGQSVANWLRAVRPGEADRLLKKRRMININLWRPIRPVERMPLAVCDASSVSRADLVRTVIGRKDSDEPSPFAGFNLAYNPGQRWYYYPGMHPNEVLAFKIFDSEMQRPHTTAHSAFEDPSSAPDAEPRISYEIRTISFLD